MKKKTPEQKSPMRIVLVGTYRGDQLKDWPGWYCWPLDGGSVASLKMLPVANPNCQSRPWGNWKPATLEMATLAQWQHFPPSPNSGSIGARPPVPTTGNG